MTISSSLNAGVAGLNSNATRLATIADNIANSSTYGYKRAEADFHSLVTQNSNSYSAGGVRTTSHRVIDQQGSLISTANSTDLAIGGRGMMPVTNAVSVQNDNGSLPLSLMTTGSFRADADGYLVTETGNVLMGWPANADGSINTFPRDTVDGLVPVQVGVNQFEGDPTTKMTLGVNLPATGTEATASGDAQVMSIEYFGNLGKSQTLNISFEPVIPATGSSNQWTMTISDSASGGATVGEYVLTFDASRADGGTLQSVSVTSGGAYDAATGSLDLTLAGGPLDLNFGLVGDSSGLTQLSDSFAPVSIVKDGSPVGNLTSVEVDANGYMHAIYDIGFTRTIYQIPLVDVPNVNGLISQDNQTYKVSAESGPFFLWDAGDGPTGEVVGYAREESATDVAAELTYLIQTQRAYSSNAKVIQTVDEMLQETTNIKR